MHAHPTSGSFGVGLADEREMLTAFLDEHRDAAAAVLDGLIEEEATLSLMRGLLLAGATTVPGIGVPMCLLSAELVVKHVRGDRSTGPLQPLDPAVPS